MSIWEAIEHGDLKIGWYLGRFVRSLFTIKRKEGNLPFLLRKPIRFFLFIIELSRYLNVNFFKFIVILFEHGKENVLFL